MKIHDRSGDITIGSIYCSPAASRIQAKSFFNEVLSVSGRTIITGDFNSKHVAWNNVTSNPKGVDLLHICNSKLFSVHPPDGPTLIPSVGQPSVVDFVLSKEIYSIKDPKVLNDLSSDHMPIIFDIPLNVSAHKDIRIFNFAKANWKGFKSQLSIESMKLDFLFPTLNSPHSIEKCISGLEKNIHEAMNKNIPKKLPYRFKYPYSNDLHLMTKERNRLRKLFLSTGNAGYKSAKRQLDRLIQRKVYELNNNSFEKKLTELNKEDLSFYQLAKCLKKKKTQIPPLINVDKSYSYSPHDKATTFAKAFHGCHMTTFQMPSAKTDRVKASIRRVDKAKPKASRTDLFKTSTVNDIIFCLKVRKAPGPDNISNRIIKSFPQDTISLLTRIFNACVHISHFPSQWKLGKIISIPKPGKDCSIPTNYRPISLLSNMGKILECLILSKLNDFEEDNKIVIPNQFGFKKKHSTIQQILRITEKASLNFNENKSTGLVLLDIEKAFDSVWHDALIHKLSILKFPMIFVKLIKS